MDSQLSKHFRQARRAKELGLGQLARLCGYRNLAKGARRIDGFEHGGGVQTELLLKMAVVLDIGTATIETLAEEDRRQFFEEWNQWASEPIVPHVVIRLMAAVYCRHDLPEEIDSVEAAEDFAAAVAKERHKQCCLVLSRRISVWFGNDGSVERVTEAVPGQANSPYMQIGNQDCVIKAVEHGIALQKVTWPTKQKI